MKRFLVLLAVAAAFAVVVPAAALADPPQRPPACSVVPTTPAVGAGAAVAQANKTATFGELCF